MNRFSRVFHSRCGRVVLALLAVSGLVAYAAGCSSDPSTLSFEDAVSKMTGLRSAGSGAVEVTDVRAVDLLKECLLKAEELAAPEGIARAGRAITLRVGTSWESGSHQMAHYGFSSADPSYLQWRQKWYRIPGDFLTMVDAMRGYNPRSYAVDPGDERFLKSYGWTPFFLISTTGIDLPVKFVHKPGEFPEVIYWAYNNELSKDIGLDLAPYLGKTVEARLYKTAEMLPESMGPNRGSSRAVVMRSEDKVIGAWMDLGRHDCFACSLKGSTLEDVTGQPLDSWVVSLIDPTDPLEQRLSKMSPEEIIETYYSAIDRKDYALAHACESRSHLISYLSSNMDNKRLYNGGFGEESGGGLGNFISVKLLKVTRMEEFERDEIGFGDKRCYSVGVEQQRIISAGNAGSYFITMKEETPATGWRIYGIGTGP
jgi:hypothetical protein